MKIKPYPKKSLIDQILNYERESGLFRWKARPESMFKSKSYADRWNNMYSGEIAGSSNGRYIVIKINKKSYVAHRLAWIVCNNEDPEYIDHINHISTDNRIVNLRSVSHRDNMVNMEMKKSNSSGVTGVYMEKQTGKWRAYITFYGKSIKLGRFVDFESAVKARNIADSKYRFHENHGLKMANGIADDSDDEE